MQDGKHGSTAISEILSSHREWSDRKRILFTNITYDMIRWWRLLWSSLGRDPSFDERILWYLLGAYMIKTEGKVPSREEFRGMAPERVKKRMKRNYEVFVLRESITDELDRIGRFEFGDEWEPLMHSLNTYPRIALRTNTLRTGVNDLSKELKRRGLDNYTVDWAPEALVLRKRANVFRRDLFKQGFFEVQDPASQTVAHFLEVKPGMRVVDVCAGQGGKTLHLSALMENKGQIIAMDDAAWKLPNLMKRARRCGCQNIRTVHVEGTKSYKRMKGTADRLLLDVPCTGLGSLRRNPEIRWTFDSKTLERLIGSQREILSRYSPLVKIGGKMVYATCSILHSEGEEQVRWFLDGNTGWELEDQKRLRPDREGFDGFYMARLIRTDCPS